MEPTISYLLSQLKNKNIRLSHQRLKVLEYLCENPSHPTVDQIYVDLKQDIPTLSKTTVYNTLNTLVEAELVKLITIEENEVRYDMIIENHGHFKCESCRMIYNFHIDIDSFETKDLDGFKIHDKNVYFKGTCPRCH